MKRSKAMRNKNMRKIVTTFAALGCALIVGSAALAEGPVEAVVEDAAALTGAAVGTAVGTAGAATGVAADTAVVGTEVGVGTAAVGTEAAADTAGAGAATAGEAAGVGVGAAVGTAEATRDAVSPGPDK